MTSTRSRRTTVVIAATALACALLYFRDPADGAPFPPCPFHALTGLDCPLCGTGRALHRLLHTHFHEAFSLNPLVVLAIPIAIVAFAFRRSLPRSTPWIALAITVVFAVLRNLPWGPVAWMSSSH